MLVASTKGIGRLTDFKGRDRKTNLRRESPCTERQKCLEMAGGKDGTSSHSGFPPGLPVL